jgi:hypothetical protein
MATKNGIAGAQPSPHSSGSLCTKANAVGCSFAPPVRQSPPSPRRGEGWGKGVPAFPHGTAWRHIADTHRRLIMLKAHAASIIRGAVTILARTFAAASKLVALRNRRSPPSLKSLLARRRWKASISSARVISDATSICESHVCPGRTCAATTSARLTSNMLLVLRPHICREIEPENLHYFRGVICRGLIEAADRRDRPCRASAAAHQEAGAPQGRARSGRAAELRNLPHPLGRRRLLQGRDPHPRGVQPFLRRQMKVAARNGHLICRIP